MHRPLFRVSALGVPHDRLCDDHAFPVEGHGPSCSRYPSSSASLTRRQKAESSGPVSTR